MDPEKIIIGLSKEITSELKAMSKTKDVKEGKKVSNLYW